MITGFSDHCTVEYILSEGFAMQCKASRFLNATTQLQQLSVTTYEVLAWSTNYNCDIDQTP